jgi:hypothetical protein
MFDWPWELTVGEPVDGSGGAVGFLGTIGLAFHIQQNDVNLLVWSLLPKGYRSIIDDDELRRRTPVDYRARATDDYRTLWEAPETRILTRRRTEGSTRLIVDGAERLIHFSGELLWNGTTNYSQFNPLLGAWLRSDHLQKEALLLDTFMELGVPSIDGGLQSSGEIL